MARERRERGEGERERGDSRERDHSPEQIKRMSAPRVRTFLWYQAGQLDEAVKLYASIFGEGFRLTSQTRMGGPSAPLFTCAFSIHGHELVGMSCEGGADFTTAVSLSLVLDKGQAEVDRVWESLIAGGGAAGQCGWCQDKFGLSWQIIPQEMEELLSNPETAAFAGRAMRSMAKIVIEGLRE